MQLCYIYFHACPSPAPPHTRRKSGYGTSRHLSMISKTGRDLGVASSSGRHGASKGGWRRAPGGWRPAKLIVEVSLSNPRAQVSDVNSRAAAHCVYGRYAGPRATASNSGSRGSPCPNTPLPPLLPQQSAAFASLAAEAPPSRGHSICNL